MTHEVGRSARDGHQSQPRALAILVRVCPPRFRARFAPQMLADLSEEWREIRSKGPAATVRFWVRTTRDVLWLAAVERLDKLTRASERDVTRGLRRRTARRARRGAPRRPSPRPNPFDSLTGDIRFALRGLRRQPTFAGTAIVTLAVGIGAAATVLSILEAVLLRPLPYDEPERLVTMARVDPTTGDVWSAALPPGTLADWMERSRSFEELATVQSLYDTDLNLTGAGEATRVDADWVSTNFFEVLGVEASLGRTFGAEDGEPGAPPVVVLSHELWTRLFSADPAAVGGRIALNEEPHTVIGVMPPRFGFVRPDGGSAALWLSESLSAEAREDRWSYLVRPVARLRAGVTAAQAQEELGLIIREIAEIYPRESLHPSGQAWGVRLAGLHDHVVERHRLPLFIVAGAVGLALLIVWINVTNLLLSRTAARAGELSLRSAIGAGPWRVSRQLVTEALVISFLGGLLGLGLTRWLVPFLTSAAPAAAGGPTGLSHGAIPLLTRAEVNGWVVGMTALTCLVTTAACAVGPVLGFLRGTHLQGLGSAREAPPGTLGRQLLAASEVSLSLILLIGVSLLWSAMTKISGLPLGFEPRQALVMTARMSPERYAALTEGAPHDRTARWTLTPDRAALIQRVEERVASIPGVRAVGATTTLPFQLGRVAAIHLPGADLEAWQVLGGRDVHGVVKFAPVTPGYFEALGLPIAAGRPFVRGDARSAPGVAIVNRRLEEDLDLDSALGRRLMVRDEADAWREVVIVGVVENVRPFGYPKRLEAGSFQRPVEYPELYVPLAQAPVVLGGPWMSTEMTLNVVARHPDDAGDAVAQAMSSALRLADPETPIAFLGTLEEYVGADLADRRFQLVLLGTLAAASLVLALVGIYGVLAFHVSRRFREVGIRMALGARRTEVTAMVVAEGARFTALGIAGGVAGAMATTRLLSPWLYEISPTEPGVFAGLAALVAGVALLACWIPARRAAGIDPMETLRAE